MRETVKDMAHDFVICVLVGGFGYVLAMLAEVALSRGGL